MKSNLVVILIGNDRPGLVETISHCVAEHGGNWEESRMAHLAGKFAGILRVSIAAERVDALERDLTELQQRGLRVIVEDSDIATHAPQRVRVEVVGNDREGIVRDLARTFARRDVNVEELSTHCEAAPMGGGQLFKAQAWLALPAGVSVESLREALEALGDDLIVDVVSDS